MRRKAFIKISFKNIKNVTEIKTIQLSKELTRSNGFSGSQIIGSADKVVLQAKTGTIVLDAFKRISMNANEILLGSEGATSPLVKGDVLEQILDKNTCIVCL